MHVSRKTQFIVIFLTILLSTIGFGVCIPVLPLYAEQFGATELQNGLLVGVFSLMVFVAAPLWGKLSDRIGRRPVLIISVLGSALGYFLMGWADTLWLLFVSRIIDGASGGNVATAQAYIADITTPENRSKAMGMIGAAFGLGFIFGPVIGGLMAEVSPHAPFYLVAVMCVMNALLVWTALPESLPPEQRTAQGVQAPLREMTQHGDGALFVTVAVAYFVSLASMSVMTAVFALFGKERFGLDGKQIGYIMAVIGFIGVLMQGGIIRRLLPKYGESHLARFGMAALAVSFVLLPLCGSVKALVGVSVLIAVGNSLIQPTLNGLGSRSMEAGWQGRAMGVLQSAGSLGRALGPMLGGWLLGFDSGHEHYGRTPFWVAAVLMLATLVYAFKLRTPQLPEAGDSGPDASGGMAL